ncbi:hypothetical protein Tco_0529258 [Tanacetum coccineum]
MKALYWFTPSPESVCYFTYFLVEEYEILKKFDFVSVKTASTPIETQKPLVKDEEASDVDVHLYRSMIGSLMYLTASRPDIMFAVMLVLESLGRALDGTEAPLLPKLFILWLAKFSTDSENLVPLGKDSTAIETLEKMPPREVQEFWMSAKSKIINNVRYITAKVAGKPVSISEASIRSDLLFDDADGIDSLPNLAIFDAIQLMDKQLLNVPGRHTLFASMLVQSTEDEGATSERPSEPQPTPSPPHPSEANVKPQSDLSPRPLPTTHIPNSILESSGGNHGGHSSSDKSLSGNEGDMTLQSVYDLCISLCTQVTDQAKEIKHLKAQIKKLKKKAKPVITHHRAWMKSVSLKQRLAGKKSLKKQWMQKESLADDTLDYMDTENAQDMGRSRFVVHEEKEREEKEVSTEDVVSTERKKVSTDRSKVSTDRSRVSTDKEESIMDSEIMERKSIIARLNKVSSPDGDYLVIYRTRVFNSPCFMVKSWLVQDQTVLGKDYSNLLIADSLLKTIWFINAPCYGNEALASPKANDVDIQSKQLSGKGKSNRSMTGTGYIKNHKKTIKNKQARTRESEEYKKKPKNQSKARKSQTLSQSGQIMVNKSQQDPKYSI